MSVKEKIARYSEYNLKRKIKAINFNEDKALFLLKIVPFLLHCNYPDLPGYIDEQDCPFGIHRFNPKNYITRDLFVKYFPGSQALLKETPSPFSSKPYIHSLKTIGSIGTIAQTPKSDCDYWVSIKNHELGEKGKKLLQQKCKAIEDWAASIGNEIYFFLMDIDQTRTNTFESKAEDESAGTALKILLKDELFRTHILVAGKMLLWWIIPPGLSAEQYESYVQKISESGSIDLNNFIDLGYISDIPKSEIFGACLWQMNKALESPFKSIIKFAYLELLLRAKDRSIRLFSDRIKLLVTFPEKLIRPELKNMALTDIDPYLLLVREVVAFYKGERVTNKRDEFIKVCLFLKTLEGLDDQKKDAEKSSHLLKTSKLMEEWNLLPENVEYYFNLKDWKFKDLVRAGSQVHVYLTDTYKKFRLIFKNFHDETGITISERDLSVLGRKLFTFHEKKPNKIEFIKGLSRETMTQDHVTLHVSRFENKDYFFAFQGEFNQLSIQEKSEYLIKRDTHLIRLLVWLIMNGIIIKQSSLHLTKNYLPVNLSDIQSLVAQLFESFPPVHFSEISPDILLKNEVIVKALAIINFTKAPVKGSKNLFTTIISTNSYGEYFLHDYQTLTQYKNALTVLLTKHFVSRWNKNLDIYIPAQSEIHLLQQMIS